MASVPLFLVIAAGAVLSCSGGDRHAPPSSDESWAAGAPAYPGGLPALVSPSRTPEARGAGSLEVIAGAGVTSYLGAIRAVVTDAEGEVVGGAYSNVDSTGVGHARNLALRLPAGDTYTVTLTATTTAPHPTTCRAVIGSVRVDAGATARAQILSWDCDGVSGYLPRAVDGDCYWLADWSFISRTSATVGELIDVRAAGHDLDGNQPNFSWSTVTPELGDFARPDAAQTAFRCSAAGENLALTVALSDGHCLQQVTQTVSCRAALAR